MNKETETGKPLEKISVLAVEEKSELIVVCHTCRTILYTAESQNFITKKVAEFRAQDHANFFSSGHHVSVVSDESSKKMEEILAINEKPEKRQGKLFRFLPPEAYEVYNQ